MTRIGLRLAVFLMVAVALSACHSSEPTQSDLTGTWSLVVVDQGTVSTPDFAAGETVSRCNEGQRSSDPAAAIEIWDVKQAGTSIAVTDAVSGTPLASGTWSNGTPSFTGTGGNWRADASVCLGACCFDAVGTDGRLRHAIKIAGDAGGCQTGMDRWEANLGRALAAGSSVIDTRAGKVEYAIWGTTGPYLLVFHGGQGGYDQIPAFAPGIVGQGFRVVSWSRPGYLRTPLPAPSSPDDQADMAASPLDALGIGRVAAFGGSAGGPPLFSFALRYPERLWALVAESAVSTTYVPRTDTPYVNELMYLFANPGGMWAFNSMFEYNTVGTLGTLRILLRAVSTLDAPSFDAWVAGIVTDPVRVEQARAILLSMSPSVPRMVGTANDLFYDARMGNLPLAGIRAPTLVVHDTNDGDGDPSNATYSAATIPGARFHWVTGGSHILALADDAAEIARIQIAFLRQYAP